MGRRLLKVFIVLLILGGILTASSGLFEDWLWFRDLGYPQLFWTPILGKIIFQVVNGAILFLFIAGALFSIRHAIVNFINERLRARLRLVQDMNRPIFSLSQRKVTIWLIVLAAVISFGASFVSGYTGWLDVLSFIHATAFGQADPIFGKDFSFYFFKLPFLKTLFNAFFGPLFFLTLCIIVFYIVTGVIRFHSLKIWQKGALSLGSAQKHVALLVGILFALKAFGFYLDIYELLFSAHGHLVGIGYTDLIANLPALKVLIILCLAGAILAFITYKFKEPRLISLPLTGTFLIAILTYGLIPAFIQSFIVLPNELGKEQPYIQHEITLTRYGYGLDKIREIDYPGNTPITVSSLRAEQATLNNIRLNDVRPMLQTYNQKQGIRQYYKFNDIDVDRYAVNEEYRQVMLGAREISAADLDEKAKTFVNMRFKYTHGYGLSASFANAVTPEGLPAFTIKDVPPVSEFPELTVSEPRIYFGETTNDWVVVNTTVPEFDYPLGSDINAENSYEGKTGIPFTPLNKLILSLRHTTPRFYLANQVTAESKMLVYRNIEERVKKLAPFLNYDEDPYLVIDEGRLKWIIDAYTTSNALPYSNLDPSLEFNYIRNSVKVIIDANDGTVDFYIVDPQDPILQTYMKIFPGVFQDISNMSPNLKSHLRYPETLFSIQSNILKTFHMTNSAIFYNKEDAWDVAKELFASTTPQYVEPYYTMMKIPGEDQLEFVLMLPFTPASSATNVRNNMISWMAARMDGDHYGELLLFKLPKNIEIDGPLQIESRINQDPNISKELALWDQKGSSVIRGNLLALPLAGSFLYVEPIYLQSSQSGSIPEMKQVVLAYQDRLVMTPTLGAGLIALFGEGAPQPTTLGQTTSPSAAETQVTSQSASNMNALLEQVNEIRALLDNLETQLKGFQNNINTEEETAEIDNGL